MNGIIERGSPLEYNPFHPPAPGAIPGPIQLTQGRQIRPTCYPTAPELGYYLSCIGEEVLVQRSLFCSEAWQFYCSGDGAPPWIEPPPDARRFQRANAIALPAEGVETLIFSETVPIGYDGVITSQTHLFTATGFAEGSGDITWRLQIGRWWVRNCGAITTTLGGFANAYPLEGGGVRLVSGQVIQYWVRLGVGALAILDPAGRLYARIAGWYYPRR